MNRAMPTHSTTPDETMARLDATLSKEEQQMLLEMIVGYRRMPMVASPMVRARMR